ncbi:MAG: polysaccharide biosynthesis/export family protein [Deltaproteobacteria bacterium]|nr:polysaccharide biosynthesis/export family protein [Deltaproteobacteria bacterium]
MKSVTAAIRMIFLTLFTASCAVQSEQEVERIIFHEVKAPLPGAIQADPHRLRVGDSLLVKFANNPELNIEGPVRPDGKFALALIGEVPAAGLTVAELRSSISGHFKRFISETRYGETLKEGDDLQIRFVFNPELNQVITVRTDGNISMPLIGDIQAAGLRPTDLRKNLLKAYARHLKNPDITVLVGGLVTRKIFADESFISVHLTKPADRLIFVGGEVQRPRSLRLEGKLTALQAIMEAGGVKETADLSQVVVLRTGPYEQGQWIKTNLTHPLAGKDVLHDIDLKDGDILVVPMSGIARLNLWIKQYIRDVMPLDSRFNISSIIYDSGSRGR